MLIDGRVAEMSDKELENLHANAVRLSQSGSNKQKEDAERLLPLIGSVLEERKQVRLTVAEGKKAAMKKARQDAATRKKA
jgi:hypothetical protein